MKNKIVKNCNFCNSKDLSEIFPMPKFPLTGIYLSSNKVKLKNYDNSFLICNVCNHGQLKKQINPKILYDNTYTHRTSKSPMATQTNNDFYQNLLSIIKKKKFKNILEIGCNDLFLTKKIQKYCSNNVVGIDPIWGKKVKKIGKKITIFGGFIDNEPDLRKIENFVKKNDIKFDLVISSHTFEHVGNFSKSLENILNITSRDALFVIETPSLDSIIRLKRYDQIFHQHLHYPTEKSILYLIHKLKCSLVKLHYNYRIWGGNITFAFKKNQIVKKTAINKKKYSVKLLKKDFKLFKKNLVDKINIIKKNYNLQKVVGFGAAQMLPIIAYHTKDNLNFLNCIYDDNQSRQNKYLPSIKPQIKRINNKKISESFILITALDSSIQILKRLSNFKPKLIFNLIDTF